MLTVTVSRFVASAIDVAVMTALPVVMPATTPCADTVAMALALEFQVTPVATPGSALTAAVRVLLAPGLMPTLRCVMATVTGRGATVIALVARRVVSAVDSTVTVVLPSATAETSPVALTVAAAGLLERQVTV